MSKHYRIIINGLFFLGILVMPFIWWPWAPVTHELPRVWFFCRFVEVLAIVSIGFQKYMPAHKLHMRLVYMVAGFFGVSVLSSALGVDIAKSIAGNYWRGDGLVTLGHFIGFSLLVALWWSRQLQKMVLWALGISVVGIAVWATVRLTGVSFGQPNFLAGWLLVAGASVVSNLANWKHSIGFLVLTFLGIFIARSWATLLLFGGYVATLFPKLRIVAIVVVLVGAMWWVQKSETFSWLGPQGVVYEGRERIFRKIWGGVVQRPVFGWGWANVDYAFESNDWPFPVTQDVYVDKAHSSILEVLATTGVIGFVVYLLMVFQTGWNLRRTRWLIPFVLFVLHAQTNVVGVGQEILFWLFVGIAIVDEL